MALRVKERIVLITYVCYQCSATELPCTILCLDRLTGSGPMSQQEGGTKKMHCVYNGHDKDMTIASIEEIIDNEPT